MPKTTIEKAADRLAKQNDREWEAKFRQRKRVRGRMVCPRTIHPVENDPVPCIQFQPRNNPGVHHEVPGRTGQHRQAWRSRTGKN